MTMKAMLVFSALTSIQSVFFGQKEIFAFQHAITYLSYFLFAFNY